jgi:predicted tellurium resistance membrane protein TerC
MKHLKKMIAPTIITALFIIYFVGVGLSMSAIKELPFMYKVLYIVFPFIMAIVMIVVLIGRIKEIRSGEEDDLSKY